MRILLVEDSADDAELLRLALEEGGFAAQIHRAETRAQLSAALGDGSWDLMICDNDLPDLDAPTAIDMARAAEAGNQPPFPIIVLSGDMDLDKIVDAMRRGARDCVDKAALPKLIPVLERELSHARTARELHRIRSALARQWGGRNEAKGMERHDQRRRTLASALSHALERREFQLHYQPQVDLASGRIAGAEVLLRWRHPTLGPVSPVEFIPLLEESGAILEVSRWILDEACRQARQWEFDGLPAIDIAVNMPAAQFAHESLIDMVCNALAGANLPPERLELEITEGTAVQDKAKSVDIMARIRALGVRIAMDDFGVGYSCLGYLKQLPMNTLKIDRVFVADLVDKEVDRNIVRAIIAMGRSLGLQIVAEGVETQAQRDFLAAAGCDLLQGYLFSPPLPPEEFANLLRTSLNANAIPG